MLKEFQRDYGGHDCDPYDRDQHDRDQHGRDEHGYASPALVESDGVCA